MKSFLSLPSALKRISANRCLPKPVRLIDFRKFFGMILSVSMLIAGSGAATPVSWVNLSTASLLYVTLLHQVAHIGEVPGDRGGGGHRRAHQMGAPAVALAALEIAVRRRGAALARLEPVGVHGEAHRTTRLAPLEAGLQEHLVEALLLGLLLDQARTGHDQGVDVARDLAAL